MGLCIGVKPGCLIKIEDSNLDVISVDEASIKIRYREQTYEVGQDKSISIDSFVSVCMGKPSNQSVEFHKGKPNQELLQRLVFEAPKRIAISRVRP